MVVNDLGRVSETKKLIFFMAAIFFKSLIKAFAKVRAEIFQAHQSELRDIKRSFKQ